MGSLHLAGSVLLIIGGHCGVPLVLITFLCSRTIAPRSSTLINFLLCWIVYATAYVLLFYAGQQTGPAPEPIVCIIQTAMIHASGPLVAFAAFALVLQLLDDLCHLSGGIRRITYLRLILLLSVPWILFAIFFIAVLAVGVSQPTVAFRKDSSYCTTRGRALSDPVYGCTAVGIICTVAIEILIAMKLRSHARSLRSSLSTSLPVSFYRILIRGTVMTLYCIVAASISLALIAVDSSNSLFFFLCTLPLVVFLVFGIHSDLLSVWFLWWKRSPASFVPAPQTSLGPRIQVTANPYPQYVIGPAEMNECDVNSKGIPKVECIV